MTIDLEVGDPDREAAEAVRTRAAARRTSTVRKTASSSGSSPRPTSEEKEDREVTTRLGRTLDRIVKALEARGDEELAEIVREDSEAMSQGIVSITHSAKFLRSPVIFLLNVAEPLLAFGRVGRVLIRRWGERRERVAMERAAQMESEQQQAAEWAANGGS